MPRGRVVERFPAQRADVFRLVHDYDRRLEWDTLLQSAVLTEGAKQAGLHAIAACKGRSFLGGIEIQSEYVSFREPVVAAVKMVNRPPFFDTFAATIRHRDLGGGWSQVEYIYQFTARPPWLRWLLHPVMHAVLGFETRRRLRALRAFFVKERQGSVPTSTHLIQPQPQSTVNREGGHFGEAEIEQAMNGPRQAEPSQFRLDKGCGPY